jgi:hypothetical protein
VGERDPKQELVRMQTQELALVAISDGRVAGWDEELQS